MPRVELRRLRARMRLRLLTDPLSSRGFVAGIRVQLIAAIAVLIIIPVLVSVPGRDRVVLGAAGAGLAAFIAVIFVTLACRNPRVAWCITTAVEIAVILLAMLVVPATFVAALLVFAIIVTASSAIAGLGVGLVVSALATASATVAVIVGDPGDDGLLSLLVALFAYPAIALSVDGYNLSRYRAGIQLAQLHDSLRRVTNAENSPETLDALVAVVKDAFAAEAVLLLLVEDGHLSISAPQKLPSKWTPERVSRATAEAFTSFDRSPVVDAVRDGATVSIDDIETDERYREWCDKWRIRLSELRLPIRSMRVVPLRRAGETIGLLHVSFRRVNAIDGDELALLEAYAEQAALVLARTRAYELVANASKLKSEFLGTISHELRTPLAATKGFVDVVLMQWDSLDDAKRRELLERASANADELTALIDQLLDFSRLEAGETELVATPTRLRPLVGDLVTRMAPVLGDHDVTIGIDPGLVVLGDAAACTHILSNLLTNAARFSPPGSEIELDAFEVEGEAVVSVHDRGIGIAPEEQVRIFERFYRGGPAPTTSRGTGIGLAIVERLVTTQGGRIWVESEPGFGATFSFTVPLAAAEMESGIVVEPAAALATETAGVDHLA